MVTSFSDEQIINLYNQDKLSLKKVSNITNISVTQLRRILTRNNIECRSTKTDDKLEAQIIERYTNGQSAESIGRDLDINGCTVMRIIKRNNVYARTRSESKKVYTTNSHFMDVIDTEEKAYFLGFMFSDGYVHKSSNDIKIELHEQDIDIIHKIIKLLFTNCEPNIGRDRECYRYFTVTDAHLRESLIALGCIPAKTWFLKFPTEDKVPKHLLHHFLRGYYDGDGCICTTGERISARLTGVDSFLLEVKSFIEQELNIEMSVSYYKDKPGIIDITIGSFNDCKSFLNWLYKDSTIYLNRKFNSYKKAINMCDDNFSKSIKYGSANIISYNGNKLTHTYIKSLSSEQKEKAAKFVFSFLRNHGFPYEQYNKDELAVDFDKLLKVETRITDGVILAQPENGLNIIRHFCPHFYEVRNKTLPSMVDVFNNDEKLMNVIKNRMGISYKETFNITGNMIRQGIRNSYTGFAASVFKPYTAKSIYDHFAPKNSVVLDISTGFGQRLLGAQASSKVSKYIGLDPWNAQIESLTEICKFFNFENVELHNIGSEFFCPVDLAVDFCFSSPPFFDKEIYNNDSSQAYNGRSFDGFVKDWLLPTVSNVYNMLKPGRLFVLNMDEKYFTDMYKVCEDKFSLIDKVVINYSRQHIGSSKADPFFVLKSNK